MHRTVTYRIISSHIKQIFTGDPINHINGTCNSGEAGQVDNSSLAFLQQGKRTLRQANGAKHIGVKHATHVGQRMELDWTCPHDT